MNSSGSPSDVRRSRALLVAAFVVPILALLVLWWLVGGLRGQERTGPASVVVTGRAVTDGRIAPSFDLPALNGTGRFRLQDFKGKVLVVNIWASWCGPCREEAPRLETTYRTYAQRTVAFLGVDHMDARSAGQGFAREFAITYPIAFDPGGTVAIAYGALGLPTTFVIGRDGQIAYRITGKVDTADLKRSIDLALERG